mgnify:CR=1 FL=1
MSEQIFPCRRVELNEVCKNPRDLALDWIANRSAEHWALISGTALASDIHGWVAHAVLMRNHERGTMRSNSLDGEFIRLISGTHHVATSFKRAGLVEGDKTAYIVDLSNKESENVERNLTFLATAGSTAPFIGLFGTVWGIMNSFKSIAIAQNTNLAVVAPGIAEALFATALGLFVAIPAVVAYNKISNDLSKYFISLETFMDEFSTIFFRQLEKK